MNNYMVCLCSDLANDEASNPFEDFPYSSYKLIKALDKMDASRKYADAYIGIILQMKEKNREEFSEIMQEAMTSFIEHVCYGDYDEWKCQEPVLNKIIKEIRKKHIGYEFEQGSQITLLNNDIISAYVSNIDDFNQAIDNEQFFRCVEPYLDDQTVTKIYNDYIMDSIKVFPLSRVSN